jgi:hypothetical protein
VCVEARDDLIETANKYRKKTNQPPIQIDAAAAHTWDEVDQGVQAACRDLERLAAQDKKKVPGGAGRVKQAFRLLCRHAGAGQTIISLIPEDAFGFSKALCAGFKVIFSAMQQAALYRDELMRALEELPALLKDASELCGSIIFKDNGDLHQRPAELYTAVFEALKHILLWFLKNTFGTCPQLLLPLCILPSSANTLPVTSVKLLVEPTGFADRLKEHMDWVRLRSQLFQSQAMKLSLLLQAQSVRLQFFTTQDVHAIAAQTAYISSEALQAKAATLDMLDKLDALVRTTLPAPSTVATPEKRSRRKSKANPKPTTSGDPSPGAAATAAFLRSLCYDPDMVPTDVSSLLHLLLPSHRRRSGASSREFDEARVVAIQSNPRLRAWLVLNQPSLLFVNARTGTLAKSEVSLVSAKIARRLVEVWEDTKTSDPGERGRRPVVLPAMFFCGEHRDWRRDPNGNAAELAMSLLLQLVDRGRELIAAAVLEQVQATVVPEDIGAICDALDTLVRSLDEGVFVVFIIDGLRCFSQPAQRMAQTKEVVGRLVGLFRARSPPTRVTLKVLLTSTARLETLEDLFEEDEVLHLQRDLPGARPENDTRWRGAVELRITDGRS